MKNLNWLSCLWYRNICTCSICPCNDHSLKFAGIFNFVPLNNFGLLDCLHVFEAPRWKKKQTWQSNFCYISYAVVQFSPYKILPSASPLFLTSWKFQWFIITNRSFLWLLWPCCLQWVNLWTRYANTCTLVHLCWQVVSSPQLSMHPRTCLYHSCTMRLRKLFIDGCC